jgi:nitrile hydratase
MNGVHDMGGMQGFGPVRPEPNEPVFHAAWEERMYAMAIAMAGLGLGNARAQMELIPPADYLAMSYYQKWYVGLVERALRVRLLTPEEIASGIPAPGVPKATPRLAAADVPARIARGAPGRLDVAVTPRFRTGQRVRARNINPVTHTRLPRYARGRFGIVERDHGVFVFPDTNAQGLGEKPQHVYSVRFGARELWGEQAKPKDTVYIDMWDDYLEAA